MGRWLSNFFGQFADAVPDVIRNMVHWAIHALSSVVYAVFRDVGSAWADYWRAADAFYHGSVEFVAHVYWWIRHLVKVIVPEIYRWAIRELHLLSKWIAQIYHDLLHDLNVLERTVVKWIDAVYKWVVRDVYDPIMKYAGHIWDDLVKWGYTAWWYITHPGKLAELIGWPFIAWLESNAWDVADKLGVFATSLLMRNARRVALILEDIISSVL